MKAEDVEAIKACLHRVFSESDPAKYSIRVRKTSLEGRRHTIFDPFIWQYEQYFEVAVQLGMAEEISQYRDKFV